MNYALLGLAVFSLFIDLLILGVVVFGGRHLEKICRSPITLPFYATVRDQDVDEEELM